MKIGELFVNLGIKGAEKAGDAITSVRSGMEKLGSTSFAAKAAIVGVMYGLEQLMSTSAAKGMGLQQFALSTGLSIDKLQRLQYEARQFGVASEEVESSVKGLQQTMLNMLTGQGIPAKALSSLSAVGFDMKKARDTYYVLSKIREAAKGMAPDLANNFLRTFGLSENYIALLRNSKIDLSKIPQSELSTDKQVANQAKVQVAWANVSAHIQKAFGDLTAKHGLAMVKDISNLVDKVLRLGDAFTTLIEKLKIIKLMGMVFEGWQGIIGGLTGSVDVINSDKKGVLHGIGKELKNTMGRYGQVLQGIGIASGATDFLMQPGENAALVKNLVSPSVVGGGSGNNATTNVTVNQSGIKDTHESVHHFKHHVKQAVGQLQGRTSGRAN